MKRQRWKVESNRRISEEKRTEAWTRVVETEAEGAKKWSND